MFENKLVVFDGYPAQQMERTGPEKMENLGTWRYVTTSKHCYPNSAEILIKEYGLRWEDNIIAYITKEITTPKFNRYRTRFRKVFCGSVKEYKNYLDRFMGPRDVSIDRE